jgi:Ni,Fe-hydrogenase I large subunit
VSKDHEYLVSKGWHHTGTKQRGLRTIKYWAHPDYEPPPCGSFYQKDALEMQRIQDFLAEIVAVFRRKP